MIIKQSSICKENKQEEKWFKANHEALMVTFCASLLINNDSTAMAYSKRVSHQLPIHLIALATEMSPDWSVVSGGNPESASTQEDIKSGLRLRVWIAL
jgi:hypothetical protein